MFIDDFGHEVWSTVLEPGGYNVTLERPYETDINGYHVLKFPFSVDGLDCETIPNYFNLDKTHIDDGQIEKTRYKIREFKIRTCFRLTSPFKDEYFHECIGKKGKVSVIKNRSGKIIVYNFFPNDDITKEELDIIKSKWNPY